MLDYGGEPLVFLGALAKTTRLKGKGLFWGLVLWLFAAVDLKLFSISTFIFYFYFSTLRGIHPQQGRPKEAAALELLPIPSKVLRTDVQMYRSTDYRGAIHRPADRWMNTE